jgi:hypothetical protein
MFTGHRDMMRYPFIFYVELAREVLVQSLSGVPSRNI